MGTRLGATCAEQRGDKKIVNRGILSPIYAQSFPSFNPCGTMFPHEFCFSGDVAAERASDRIKRRKIGHVAVRAATNEKSA